MKLKIIERKYNTTDRMKEKMESKIRKKDFILFLMVFVVGISLGTIGVNAYNVMYRGGFYPVPAYVCGSNSFSSETMTAIHNACLTWNGAGAGNLVYRNTSTHNITQYPYENNRNDITKGTRGSNTYLMQTKQVQYGTINSKTTMLEADIDINVSHPFGSASTSLDTQSVMTHELGHLLGLAECFEHTNCIMYQRFEKGEIRRTLM